MGIRLDSLRCFGNNGRVARINALVKRIPARPECSKVRAHPIKGAFAL